MSKISILFGKRDMISKAVPQFPEKDLCDLLQCRSKYCTPCERYLDFSELFVKIPFPKLRY